MSVPQLRFKEFGSEWQEKSLAELTSLITKGTTPQNFTESGVTYVKIEGFKDGYIDQSKCLFIDEKIHLSELKRSILKEGDILFAIAGATIGKCGLVTKEILPANTNQALAIIRLKKEAHIDFTLSILKSKIMLKYIQNNIAGGAQPNLNLQQIANFSFIIPTLPEQTKIANFLTTIDERINQLTHKKELMTQYKQGVMQKIFSQQLRFKDDNGEDFGDWENKPIAEVINNYGGTALEEFVSTDGTHNFISIGNYEKNGHYFDNGQRIVLNEKTKQKLLNKNDLVMVLNDKTQAGDLIGSTLLISEDNKFIYNQRSERLVCKSDIVESKFVWYLFNSIKFRKEVFSISQGGTQIYVNFPAVKKLNIPVPCFIEQTKIANFLTAIDEKIQQITQQIETTKQYKQGLLQQMFV